MKSFTKVSNGHTLEIQVNDEKLLKQVNEDIKEMEDLKLKIAEYEKERIEAKENDDECYDDWRYDYDMQSVYGDPEDENDYLTPDEIIADREEFKKIINRFVSGDGSELWKLAQFKKNGTFKKTSKPMIKEAINGTYYMEEYGWNADVLRLVPVSDTLARVEFDRITLHY